MVLKMQPPSLPSGVTEKQERLAATPHTFLYREWGPPSLPSWEHEDCGSKAPAAKTECALRESPWGSSAQDGGEHELRPPRTTVGKVGQPGVLAAVGTQPLT